MSAYIATFYTHLGALRFYRVLVSNGDGAAVMMPVPRRLSASCGTCVRFSLPFCPEWADEDLDSVYEQEGDSYRTVYVSEKQ